MHPSTTEDWLNVAAERAADAEAILGSRQSSIGSVYIVGYGIECSLKAYLRACGRKFPQSGQQGHNLTALWKAAGFRKRDLGGHAGCNTFFLESWNTAIRYTLELEDGGITTSELVGGGRKITGWLHTQTRRRLMRKGKH